LTRFTSENSELLEQEVEIKVDMSKLDAANIKLTDAGQNGLELHFSGVFTPESIKRWFNERFKGHRFIPKSESMKAMDEMLKKMELKDLI
jgi:hypothetical protein